jgi:UDP-N-acetylmuramyl pentapeptide phosphotransferase/UDP-N-acetylglucosamine-1-phosphate transferase
MILSVVVTFLLAAGLTPLLAAGARRRGLLDVPNARSSHILATPRTGGAAFVSAFLVGIAIANAQGALTHEARLVVGSATVLALLGLADDLRSLSAGVRLLVQVAVAWVLVLVLDWQLLPSLMPNGIGAAVTVLWIVACTNAYNFMDGIDGIAGGQAVAAGLGWAVLGFVIGSPPAAAIGLLVTAAVGGFLIYNRAPAKVFMGDAGSAFLGFLFGAMPLAVGHDRPDFMIWAALLVWPFLFDTGFTLIRRIRRREDIFSAHRSHLYQRLTIAGSSHSRVALLYVFLALIGVAASIALALRAAGAVMFAAIAISLSAFVLWRYVTSREARIAGRSDSLPFSN